MGQAASTEIIDKESELDIENQPNNKSELSNESDSEEWNQITIEEISDKEIPTYDPNIPDATTNTVECTVTYHAEATIIEPPKVVDIEEIYIEPPKIVKAEAVLIHKAEEILIPEPVPMQPIIMCAPPVQHAITIEPPQMQCGVEVCEEIREVEMFDCISKFIMGMDAATLALKDLDTSLEEFDPFFITPVNNILIIGPRESGKSVLVESILKYRIKKYIDNYYITSGGSSLVRYYNLLEKPSSNDQYYTSLDVTKLRDLVSSKYNGSNRSNYVVLDDCFAKELDINNSLMHQLLHYGPCLNIGTTITLQKPLSIVPSLRSAFDFIFIFETNEANKIKIYNDYLKKVTSLDEYLDAMEEVSQDMHQMLVVNTMHKTMYKYKVHLKMD